MSFEYFSHNGSISESKNAVIPLSDIEYAYGFGVYETIRFSKGIVYFPEQHIDRLQKSAQIIGIEHNLSSDFILSSINDLLAKLYPEACNIKILLVGGKSKDSANLYIQCLSPLFVDRKLYKSGVKVITNQMTRPFPHAKSLNMLPSYIAYSEAKKSGAYDALLIDTDGNITEGTRTNFFAIKDRTIISPPSDEILLGVTRDNVIKVATANGFDLIEQKIQLDSITKYDGLFITSTSSKILPISQVNDKQLKIPETILELIDQFNNFLDDYKTSSQ